MSKKAETKAATTKTVAAKDSKENAAKSTGKKPFTVDEVLKLPKEEAFEKDLTEILDSDAESDGETVVIALIDFDEFMHINTDFGREVGDRVLIETGRYIKEKAPKTARVYRMGGDEFGMIFKGTMEREDIFLFLNELKSNFPVKTPDGASHTVTIGMATAFLDASRYAELVRKADGALYRAKINGRNRVAMAKEEKMIPKTSHYTQDQLQRLNKLSKREDIGEAILLREALDMLLKKYDI